MELASFINFDKVVYRNNTATFGGAVYINGGRQYSQVRRRGAWAGSRNVRALKCRPYALTLSKDAQQKALL